MRAAIALALLAIVVVGVPSSAPTATHTGPGTIVVSGGTLIDGTVREPIPNAMVVVRDGLVTAVIRGGGAAVASGPNVLDTRGKWIVPGLIDMHVHYQPGWMDPLFLRHGITTVRDVGSGLDSILMLREDNRHPGIARPRLFACGPLIDGPFPRHGTGISVSVQTVTEARAAVRRLIDRGVDCVKVYEQEMMPLLGEVPPGRLLYWRRAASATSAHRKAGVTRRLGCLKRFVATLEGAGGNVVAGSDTSNPYVIPGASLHRELELLAEAGLSPRQALAAATRTAAAFLGQAQTLGTVEVGKRADLVVLGADPMTSIRAVRHLEIVVRDGRVVWRRTP